MPASKAFAENDYSDPRTDEQRERERRQVRRQVASLKRLARDSYYQRRAFAKLDGRRRSRAERVQLQAIQRARRPDVIVAEGSVVTWDAEGCRCRDVEVDPEAPASMLRAAEALRADGVGAAVNYVIPLAGYIKGAGGPEPSAGARPFGGTGTPAPQAALVAVLDTGISADTRSDGYLAMPVDAGDIDALDEFPPDGLLDAGAGHGAFVAGIVQQVAPDARVLVHKVMDSDGITTDAALADGLRRAAAAGAKIINMSLGTETLDDSAPPALRAAVGELREQGVLVVCAAGNSADCEPVWPAALSTEFDNVVAVAALDPAGDPASWSSHGDWVTCSTIGEGVVSTYVEGTEDGMLIDDPDPDTYGPDSWACWTGTSFAAPQITGALVRLMSEDSTLDTPAEALRALQQRGGTLDGGYGWSVRILPGT
ncbi:S8 family peptidase [Pseudonocardia humida]|uniref:S8/S53 family peptidase n=1 Tax=Pseudonocardia humida TaxID=2800819 RepID=A0ABT1A8D6_9PSEU|nr:S8/S53 family peptidase [Pseudonocardia humida]MCO1659290.1 S8/S53 family peptidase [Pseudonocardia humida]